MFDRLGKGLSDLIRRIVTGTTIDKKAVKEILQDLKVILLQSDVDTKLTDELINIIRKKCLEEKIPAGLTLREHVLKVIYGELVKLLGGKAASLSGRKKIMFVGLFGTGKCVDKDSYIPLASGEILKIGKLYERYKVFGVEEKVEEGYKIELKNSNLKVFSLNPLTLEIEEKAVSTLWKLKAPGNLLKINLDNGKMHEIVVTPEHPFFVLLDGNIVKIRADQLQKGFAVVIPNKLNINPTRNIDLKKEILEKLDDRFYIFDKNLGYKIKKHLTDRYGTLENAHMKLNLNINYSFFTHILKKGKFPFSIIKKYPKLLLKIDKLRLKTKEGKKWIEFPTEMNEELAEFLGFVIGEGNIDKNSIHITNKEKTITKRVRYLSNKLFGINAIETQDKRNKVRRISLGSKALVFLFNLIFDIPIGKKNDKVKIPTQILKSPNSVLKSFIRAYFDGEGYVGENSREMEITSASKDLISTLGMALLRFGILSSYSSRKIGDNYYYRLFIRGRFAEIYAEKISSIVDSKLARLKKLKAIGEHQTPGKQEIILLGSLLKEIRELYGVPIGYIQNFVNSYGCFEKKGAISRKSLIKFLDALEASKKSWYWILKSSSKGVIYEKLQNRFRNRGWLNATLNRLEELNWIEKRVNPHKIFVLTEKGKEKLEQIENFDHLIYETVKKIANSNLSWIKIKNISTVKSSSKFVYDLTVNDFHNFVANGMIVHNTTSIAKLARHFQKQGLRPALLALDYHRPAAIDQLVQLGKQINVPVYFDRDNDPYKGAKDGIEKFKNFDAILIDTSGRNALDSKLAEELKKLGEIIKPDEVLLTIPADIGKVAKSQSEEFNKLVGITGVFVTKLDGTAKGGGCLSACAATGAKVKFIGTGEKIEDLEVYNPERFVSRLLGLGDLQTLLEKAKEAEIKPEKIEKIVEGKFTLQEFYEQIEAMGKMGSLEKVASMIPGFGMLKLPKDLMEKQEKKLKKFKVIIQSLTPEERETPKIINSSRIRRCAKGAGVSESDVRELLKQYEQLKKVTKTLGGKGQKDLMKLIKKFGGKFPGL